MAEDFMTPECPDCGTDLTDRIGSDWVHCPYCGSHLGDIVEYPESFGLKREEKDMIMFDTAMTHMNMIMRDGKVMINQFDKIEEIVDFEEPDYVLDHKEDINRLLVHLTYEQKRALTVGSSVTVLFLKRTE